MQLFNLKCAIALKTPNWLWKVWVSLVGDTETFRVNTKRLLNLASNRNAKSQNNESETSLAEDRNDLTFVKLLCFEVTSTVREILICCYTTDGCGNQHWNLNVEVREKLVRKVEESLRGAVSWMECCKMNALFAMLLRLMLRVGPKPREN